MRVAVLSDIHSNLAALEAVLDDCRACDRVWCLGDVVGYGPDPSACIARVRDVAEVCIAGNHDLAAVGLLSIAQFNALAAEAAEWTFRQLSPSDRQFLCDRPAFQILDDYYLTHGSPLDPVWEYLETADQARENFDFFRTTVCFVGHSHVPVAFSTSGETDRPTGTVRVERPREGIEIGFGDRRHIINVGSVGQPRDGDPRSAYVIVDLEKRSYQRRRVSYDISKTQDRMRAEALPEPLRLRLAYGR
jgi:diadenosine tetraphosphatase ApaH/serine/threonine PP2A family protein phosphatase